MYFTQCGEGGKVINTVTSQQGHNWFKFHLGYFCAESLCIDFPGCSGYLPHSKRVVFRLKVSLVAFWGIMSSPECTLHHWVYRGLPGSGGSRNKRKWIDNMESEILSFPCCGEKMLKWFGCTVLTSSPWHEASQTNTVCWNEPNCRQQLVCFKRIILNKQANKSSLYFLYLLNPNQGHGGLDASFHWAYEYTRDRSPVHHRVTQRQTA